MSWVRRATLALAACATAAGGVAVMDAATANAAKGKVSAGSNRSLCQVLGSCTAHWVMLDHHRTKVIGKPFMIDRHGVVHAINPRSAVQNFATGTCWSSLGASNNGAWAVLYGCNPNAANQEWYDVSTGYGTGIKNEGDGKCLNNQNGSGGNNNHQIMWSCYTSQNETYYNQSIDYGYAVITYAGTCLTSLGNSGNNAPLYSYACNYGANQTWNDLY